MVPLDPTPSVSFGLGPQPHIPFIPIQINKTILLCFLSSATTSYQQLKHPYTHTAHFFIFSYHTQSVLIYYYFIFLSPSSISHSNLKVGGEGNIYMVSSKMRTTRRVVSSVMGEGSDGKSMGGLGETTRLENLGRI